MKGISIYTTFYFTHLGSFIERKNQLHELLGENSMWFLIPRKDKNPALGILGVLILLLLLLLFLLLPHDFSSLLSWKFKLVIVLGEKRRKKC
jgi:hypothetical protein